MSIVAGALQRLAALDQDAELGAPCPVATITAVGTASPIAQGQAMISTATAAAKARTAGAVAPARSAATNQTTNVAIGDRDDDRDEHAADAIGEVLDRRARALRVAHQADDLREDAVGAERRRAIAEARRCG